MLSFEHGGMHKFVPVDGPAYLLPRSLSVHSLDLHKQPSMGADVGTLFIDAAGNAHLRIANSRIASMKALDKTLGKELLGAPVGPHGEDEDNAYFWTFNILAMQAFEPNIYHVDVQYADTDQHWKKYRVRGYQISNPQWQAVEK